MDFRLTYGALDLCDVPFAIEFGTDLGAPENVTQALAFLLQDGEIELSPRASNRTISFVVQIMAANMGALADAEALLVAESEKPLNTLTVDPGDGVGVPTVFETYRGQVTFLRDDNQEIALLRRYQVTVRALPFGRSVDQVVANALASSGSTTTNVDTMSASTGWTATINGSAASVTHAAGPPTTNSVVQTAAYGEYTLALQKTVSQNTSSLKYLMVDWSQSGGLAGAVPVLVAIGDGVTLPRIAESLSPTAGFVRTWYKVEANTLGTLVLQGTTAQSAESLRAAVDHVLTLDNVAVTDIRPFIGTARQQLRSVEVSGSVRGPASLALSSPTSSLGDTLIYVYPDNAPPGYIPSLRPYLSASGATTTDSTYVSGAWNDPHNTPVTFSVPVSRLPRGLHVLMARADPSLLTTSITWSATTTLGGTDLGSASGSLAVSSSGGFVNLTLGRFIVPTNDVPADSGAVLNVTIAATGGAMTLDEVWLFATKGWLTQVACGTGTAAAGGPASRVFMTPATTETPRPVLRIGYSADGSDAFYPADAFWQPPQFTPGSATVFTVTANATDSACSMRHYDWYHTSAAS